MIPVLDRIIRHTRQAHALEHATLHLLGRHIPKIVVGRSNWRGFWLIGEVDTDAVLWAATEALARLQNQQAQLATHRRCGTNVVAGAGLGGSMAMGASLLAVGSRVVRWGAYGISLLVGLLVARPLGMFLQQHVTTLSEVGDVRIKAVRRSRRGALTMHRVDLTWDR